MTALERPGLTDEEITGSLVIIEPGPALPAPV